MQVGLYLCLQTWDRLGYLCWLKASGQRRRAFQVNLLEDLPCPKSPQDQTSPQSKRTWLGTCLRCALSWSGGFRTRSSVQNGDDETEDNINGTDALTKERSGGLLVGQSVSFLRPWGRTGCRHRRQVNPIDRLRCPQLKGGCGI